VLRAVCNESFRFPGLSEVCRSRGTSDGVSPLPGPVNIVHFPSNDGFAWSPVGTLSLYVDNTAFIYAAVGGTCSGIFMTLAALAAYYWVRWRRLRKVVRNGI